MRSIGLHLRLTSTITALAEQALLYNLATFQCFFIYQRSGKTIFPGKEDIESFLTIRRKYFHDLYVHGSYWINLSSLQYNGYKALKREVSLAKKLEFTHMILHPGSAKGAIRRIDGIKALARMLNKIIQEEPSITFVLENTAHAKMSVGSDIHDFNILLQLLDNPDRVSFCIDTAHAFNYGYDLSDENKQHEFVDYLQKEIGIDKIALLHLNDTTERLGSRIDRHAVIGKGKIGIKPLKSFMLNPLLQNIPIILELPMVDQEVQQSVFKEIVSWQVSKKEEGI